MSDFTIRTSPEALTAASEYISKKAALIEMATGWKGESATAYFARAETTKEAIISTSEKLGSIASSIRRQAKRTYDAEMAALRLAEERTSGSGGGGGRAF